MDELAGKCDTTTLTQWHPEHPGIVEPLESVVLLPTLIVTEGAGGHAAVVALALPGALELPPAFTATTESEWL